MQDDLLLTREALLLLGLVREEVEEEREGGTGTALLRLRAKTRRQDGQDTPPSAHGQRATVLQTETSAAYFEVLSTPAEEQCCGCQAERQ